MEKFNVSMRAHIGIGCSIRSGSYGEVCWLGLPAARSYPYFLSKEICMTYPIGIISCYLQRTRRNRTCVTIEEKVVNIEMRYLVRRVSMHWLISLSRDFRVKRIHASQVKRYANIGCTALWQCEKWEGFLRCSTNSTGMPGPCCWDSMFQNTRQVLLLFPNQDCMKKHTCISMYFVIVTKDGGLAWHKEGEDVSMQYCILLIDTHLTVLYPPPQLTHYGL